MWLCKNTVLHCLLITFTVISSALADEYHPDFRHPVHPNKRSTSTSGNLNRDWFTLGQNELNNALQLRRLMGVAKNVILFIGDGMGVSTVSAARLFNMQVLNKTFEESSMGWEKFPYAGLSKTYNTNQQTPDSAGTATAFLTGYKARAGTLGVKQEVEQYDCQASLLPINRATSILKHSQTEGKWTGIVTTTRVTHATPAAAYAYSAHRGWEAYVTDPECKDIARQLVEDNPDIRVIMGGGRQMFTPNTTADPEYEFLNGSREDKRNLINEWLQDKAGRVPEGRYSYVHNSDGLNALDMNNMDYLLGLFERSHMHYEADRQDDIDGEPSVAEMVEKSIQLLSKNENGFFLEVEGGRIDHAHHGTNAWRSLRDTVAMSDAVQKAVELTNEQDTLIVVSADHSHVFTISGYPSWSNPIMGISDNDVGTDGRPYTTLSYANGPGFDSNKDPDTNERLPLSNENTTQVDYRQDTNFHLRSETHGGEDVAIYARGPMSHLFHGVHEQSYIAHVMMYASCVGPNKQHCQTQPRNPPDCDQVDQSAAAVRTSSVHVLALIFAAVFALCI